MWTEACEIMNPAKAVRESLKLCEKCSHKLLPTLWVKMKKKI